MHLLPRLGELRQQGCVLRDVAGVRLPRLLRLCSRPPPQRVRYALQVRALPVEGLSLSGPCPAEQQAAGIATSCLQAGIFCGQLLDCDTLYAVR